MRSLLLAIVSLIGPVLLGYLAWDHLSEVPAYTESGVVRAMSEHVKEVQPDLVVVGPSFARTDVHPATLAEKLHANPVVLSQSAASGSVWYAITKYRVYEQGINPKLVVVVGTMPLLMTIAPNTTAMRQLTDHFATPDEAIAKKSWPDGGNPTWRRILEQRVLVRNSVVNWVRDGLVGLFWDPNGIGGRDVAEAASAKVFAAEQKSGMTPMDRFLPVVEEADRQMDESFGPTVTDPDASFLPDLAALVAAHGGKLVVVLAPTAPNVEKGQQLAPAIEKAVVEKARDLGIGWLDMRKTDLPPSAYLDGRHLSPQGSRKFSEMLAERLEVIGAWGDGPIAPPRILPTPVRDGTPSPLSLPPKSVVKTGDCTFRVKLPSELSVLSDEGLYPTQTGGVSPLMPTFGDQPLQSSSNGPLLRSGCNGVYSLRSDAMLLSLPSPGEFRLDLQPTFPTKGRGLTSLWWIYPGTHLRWTWENWTEGAIKVVADIVSLGEESPDLQVAGQSIPLQATGPATDDHPARAYSGELELTPQGSWSVTAGSEHTFMLIQRLLIQVGRETLSLVDNSAVRTIPLFVTPPSYAGPPPSLNLGPFRQKGKAGSFQLPETDRLGCSPYEVLENGTPLPNANPPGENRATPLQKQVFNKTSLVGNQVIFFPTELGVFSGKTFDLRYREDRRCLTSQWLLPGDQLTATIDRGALNKLRGPVRTIRLNAQTNAVAPEGSVELSLKHGAETIETRTVMVEELLAGLQWNLEPQPREHGLEPFVMTLTNVDGPALLLEGVLGDG